MRINSKNGSNNYEKNIKFSCFNPKNKKSHKTTNIDYSKALTLHKNDQSEIIIEKSPKSNPNSMGYDNSKKSEKMLLKSKTLFTKSNNNGYIRNIKSSTFKSRSQSLTPNRYDSGKINKDNMIVDSESGYHSELFSNPLLYFHINDNKLNKKYKIRNNKISTTKYNIISFFPKGLLLQFTRLPNIFFLFTAIIQSIPVISPLTSLTAIIPLIFVLGVSMIREFIEDWTRKTYDDLNNKEEVIVFREGSFKKEYSESLRIGEIVVVPEGKTIPADMVLIDSGLRDGIAYVETSSLDGEKALKFKLANKQTVGIFSDENNKREINFRNLIISGEIEIAPPNQNLNEIYGKIKFFLKNNEIVKANNIFYEISLKEFILKGSVLRNSNWIVGVIVYTGMYNKIILNSKKPRTKISQIEKRMNNYLLYVFIFLMLCCLVCSILHNHGYKKHRLFYDNFILIKRSPFSESFITFFTYFLLLNTMIPISLIVTLEIIKIIQGLLIECDTKLYSKFRHVFCKARAVSINEELGSVNFIFSDKTGTLTLNQLKFKYCLINNKCYEYKRDINYNKTFSIANNKKLLENFSFIKDIIPFHDNFFSNEVSNKRKYLKERQSKKKIVELSALEEEIEAIDEFWKAIALTNECIVSEEKGDLKYLGTSPDDNELVKTACNQGYKLFSTSIDKKMVRIGREGEFSFEILHVLGFSSERRRMSIIFRDKNVIKIYCKGADIEIVKRLSDKAKSLKKFEVIYTELNNFSKYGFRTLMYGYKIINESEYTSWIDKIRKGEKFQKNRLIERLYDLIECDFELLGGTVLEDKLQNKVPDTISSLKRADIKIWVLTGDKMDTVENIGISCNLLTFNEKIFRIKISNNYEDMSDNSATEIDNFFEDFKYFLENSLSNNNNKNNLQIFSNKNNKSDDKSSMSVSDINSEFLSNLKDNNLISNFSIIIESPLFHYLFRDDEMTEKFLSIAQYATTVICCRASPFQKSQVVQKIKKFNPQAVTLAIGDGRNDISMLMEANIGVGIFGEEGTSAAQAADFAIGEFKLLKRLLFFHGRINLYRISRMIMYFFYKNFIFTMTQFFFAFYNLSSGQTLMDDWYITCYNLVFTALPLCVCTLTDIDIKEEDSEECRKDMPLIYKENRDERRYFTLFRFLATMIRSFFLSCIIFLTCSLSTIIDIQGNFSNIWYMSLKNYFCILIIVTINLFIEAKFIVYYLPAVVILSTFVLFFLFLLLVHYGLVFNFNSKASIFPSLSVLKFYLILFVVCTLMGVIDYSIKLYDFIFVKSLASKLEQKRAMLTSKEQKINNLSRNSSFDKSDGKRESLKSDRRNSSYYQIGIDGKSFYKTKYNDSLWDNSKIKMQNNNNNEMNDLFHLNINSIKKRSKVLDDSNYLMSRVFQNSSSISSSSPNNSQNNISNNNNYNIFINRNFKKGNAYSRSYKENNNRDIEILNNNINIITINKNRSNTRNRLSLLRKLDTNINNMEKNSKNENNVNFDNFENNDNNENINNINNNQNIKTTELMLNNDISQHKKK